MDHKIKQMRIELASVRQAQALASVEAVTEGACRRERKAEAGNIELTEEQQHSSDTADNVPGKFEPNCELLEVASEQVHEKSKEKTPQALDGCFSEDEGETVMETTPCKSSQPKRGAMKEKSADQKSSQDPDSSGRPPCGFEDKPRGPAQESEPATRDRAVIDISFNKRDQSCLVRLRHPDSDPLLESGCKKLDERASSGQLLSRLEEREEEVTHAEEPSTDGGCESDQRASTEQLLSRLEERDLEGTRHEEPSTDGGCESTASTEDTDETELEKYQVSCLGHVKISSCLGRSSKEEERKKNQRKGSVLQSGQKTSDKERHRNLGNCTSWKKLSTRRRGRGRGVVQQEKPSTVGDSDQGGPNRNTKEPKCYRADPKRVHRETSARLRRGGSKMKNSDTEMGPSSRRTEPRRKRLRRIRVLRSDNEASGKKRHLKLEKCTHKKKLSSRRGDETAKTSIARNHRPTT
ncbi:hypothetical protein HPB47_017102 [Ixodes persulcatus]|uniref:Uncharacterized protein n=1 Tax=Ixodes persulcatus TaxID=34615 RepID=A0AC60QSR4_IXOPE|nr:hypothetical protein HPB47_017102 [Ixodes persulcatus]